jgi:hypothetical protein
MSWETQAYMEEYYIYVREVDYECENRLNRVGTVFNDEL